MRRLTVKHISFSLGLLAFCLGGFGCTPNRPASSTQEIAVETTAEDKETANPEEMTEEPPLFAEDIDSLTPERLLALEPSPMFSPEQVVKIQLQALRHNDANDRGIATTFKFASPSNKKFTGPLDRFASMIKSSYSLMLDYDRAKYDEVDINGQEATQRVRLISADGVVVVYKFTLSKQSDESCAGCWMTDSVIVEEISRLDQNQI